MHPQCCIRRAHSLFVPAPSKTASHPEAIPPKKREAQASGPPAPIGEPIAIEGMPVAVEQPVRAPSTSLALRSPSCAAPEPEKSYQSPLKKLKTAIARHKRVFIDTVDDLREFIMRIDGTDKELCATVRIKARLLWSVVEVVNNLPFLRLFFGEWQATEPFEEQQRAFKDAQREDPFEANQFLIMVSLLKVDINNPRLPRPGDVVTITPFRLNVYRECCQVDAKLYGLNTLDTP